MSCHRHTGVRESPDLLRDPRQIPLPLGTQGPPFSEGGAEPFSGVLMLGQTLQHLALGQLWALVRGGGSASGQWGAS